MYMMYCNGNCVKASVMLREAFSCRALKVLFMVNVCDSPSYKIFRD